jgi:tetratricopeptide (TPR) repeat protein
MKKTIVLVLAAFLPFFAGCGKTEGSADKARPAKVQVEKSEEESKIANLNDLRALSMNLAQEYYANGTREALEEAMNVNQKILEQGGDTQDMIFRMQLLSSAGKNKEAFLLQDKIIPAQENHPGRLFYNGLKYKIKKDKKKADEYFKKALAEADKLLKETPGDIELLSIKLNSYMFSGEKQKAKAIVYEIYNSDKNNPFFRKFHENFDKMSKEAEDYYNSITL